MAIRIPVVISQNERRHGSVADYEEQLLTRLILENGLDATLIADLKSIELDTTDHLCIEGLKGDFALATWESDQYVFDHLHRLGIPSLEIVPVDGSEKKRSVRDEKAVPKKIFLVSLDASNSIDATIQTLRELRQARSTPVFSIGLGGVASRSASSTSVPSRGADGTLPVESMESVKPTALNPRISPMPANSQFQEQAYAVVDDGDDEFPNIDKLMEDLDKFEI